MIAGQAFYHSDLTGGGDDSPRRFRFVGTPGANVIAPDHAHDWRRADVRPRCLQDFRVLQKINSQTRRRAGEGGPDGPRASIYRENAPHRSALYRKLEKHTLMSGDRIGRPMPEGIPDAAPCLCRGERTGETVGACIVSPGIRVPCGGHMGVTAGVDTHDVPCAQPTMVVRFECAVDRTNLHVGLVARFLWNLVIRRTRPHMGVGTQWRTRFTICRHAVRFL